MTLNLYNTEKPTLTGFFSEDVRDTVYNSYVVPYKKAFKTRSDRRNKNS